MSSLTSGRAGAAVSTASRVDALLLATATSACKVRGGSADSHYEAFSSQTARHLLRRNQRGAPGAVCHVTSEERPVCVVSVRILCLTRVRAHRKTTAGSIKSDTCSMRSTEQGEFESRLAELREVSGIGLLHLPP
jgi:hypothetical protein